MSGGPSEDGRDLFGGSKEATRRMGRFPQDSAVNRPLREGSAMKPGHVGNGIRRKNGRGEEIKVLRAKCLRGILRLGGAKFGEAQS